jgi:hypothetical protein
LLAVFLPLGFLWFGFVMPGMPQVRDSDELATLASPSSKGYQSIAIHSVTHATAYPNEPDPPPGDLQIKLTDANGMLHELVIDPATLHFREAASPPGAMSTTLLDTDSLAAWAQRFAVSGSRDQLGKEMDAIVTQVRQLVSRPPIHRTHGSGEFASTGSSSSSSRMPLPWLSSIPVIAAALIWCVGMIRILMTPRKPS